MTELNQVCFRTLHHVKPWSLEAYLSVGGYEVWRKILREKTPPDDIINELKKCRTYEAGEERGFPPD